MEKTIRNYLANLAKNNFDHLCGQLAEARRDTSLTPAELKDIEDDVDFATEVWSFANHEAKQAGMSNHPKLTQAAHGISSKKATEIRG